MPANTLEPAGRITPRIHKSCVHHWIIEPANGPFSDGACKRCGATRDFRNSLESLVWEHWNEDHDLPLAG
jgi:hypothetical protein